MPLAPEAALPPTIQRIAGSWRRRSASLTSSYPASRPNTDCRSKPDQRMAAIPAGACVGEHVARHRAETESVVEFAIGQQSGIGGDPRAMELKLQAAVEIEPERAIDSIHPLGSP